MQLRYIIQVDNKSTIIHYSRIRIHPKENCDIYSTSQLINTNLTENEHIYNLILIFETKTKALLFIKLNNKDL